MCGRLRAVRSPSPEARAALCRRQRRLGGTDMQGMAHEAVRNARAQITAAGVARPHGRASLPSALMPARPGRAARASAVSGADSEPVFMAVWTIGADRAGCACRNRFYKVSKSDAGRWQLPRHIFGIMLHCTIVPLMLRRPPHRLRLSRLLAGALVGASVAQRP